MIVERAAARIRVPDQFDAKKVLNFTLLPVDGVNGVGERSQLRLVLRDGHADEDETVRRVQRVKVVNKKDVVPGAGVLGKHTGEARLVFPVENRAERAGRFEFCVQVKLVRLRGVRVFDLRAEAFRQFFVDDSQFRQQVHRKPPNNSAARRASS